MFNINLLNELDYKSISYKKNEVIINEGDDLTKVGFILSGEISISSVTIDGFSFEIQRLKEGMIFGDSLISLNKEKVPGTIKTLKDSKIIYLTKDEYFNLLKNNHEFLLEYLEYTSDRNVNQQYKIKLLGQPSIREKILFYIKDEMIKQKSNTIILKDSKEKLSEFMGLQRPSFSRELMRMKKDGIIDYTKNSITFLG